MWRPEIPQPHWSAELYQGLTVLGLPTFWKMAFLSSGLRVLVRRDRAREELLGHCKATSRAGEAGSPPLFGSWGEEWRPRGEGLRETSQAWHGQEAQEESDFHEGSWPRTGLWGLCTALPIQVRPRGTDCPHSPRSPCHDPKDADLGLGCPLCLRGKDKAALGHISLTLFFLP